MLVHGRRGRGVLLATGAHDLGDDVPADRGLGGCHGGDGDVHSMLVLRPRRIWAVGELFL